MNWLGCGSAPLRVAAKRNGDGTVVKAHMKTFILSMAIVALCGGWLLGAAPATAPTPTTKPKLKITPGQVIVPTDAMRRIWGELISVDLATRTGTFRKETTDEVMRFTVLPYAELLHHAAFGDLEDFRIGERAIFRMHENENGEWTWLTYIQDEMNMMNGHKEYFYVDSIAPDKGELICTQANFDKSFVREKDIPIETDANTRYWKAGEPAKFADIKVGDKLRTKTHGSGKGKVRVAWEVFLDDQSLQKLQAEQTAAHNARMMAEGLPGYVDEAGGEQIKLTLFQEGGEQSAKLRAGMKVSVAAAGVDRKATGQKMSGTVVAAKMAGRLCKVTLEVGAAGDGFKVGGLVRVWMAQP